MNERIITATINNITALRFVRLWWRGLLVKSGGGRWAGESRLRTNSYSGEGRERVPSTAEEEEEIQIKSFLRIFAILIKQNK